MVFSTPSIGPLSSRRHPDDGQIKLNTDTIIGTVGSGGLGIIFRDVQEYVLATATKVEYGVLDSILAKTHAISCRLQLAIDLCFFDVVVESDWLLIMDLL